MPPVILDTNVFVAAAFKRSSASATILRSVAHGEHALIWDEATRSETKNVLTRIPPISWDAVASLFQNQNQWNGTVDLQAVEFVSDPEDRKFAALSQATGAVLVSSDSDLLDHRGALNICTPSEFLHQLSNR